MLMPLASNFDRAGLQLLLPKRQRAEQWGSVRVRRAFTSMGEGASSPVLDSGKEPPHAP